MNITRQDDASKEYQGEGRNVAVYWHKDGEKIDFVPCEVVARCINDTDGAELPDAAKQGRLV